MQSQFTYGVEYKAPIRVQPDLMLVRMCERRGY
jgi:hypothetical protein